MMELDYKTASLNDKLKCYYEHFFPIELLCNWLSYGGNRLYHPFPGDSLLRRRELSITLQGDIYIRHLSFASPQALRARLIRDKPEKIDIGALWKYPPGNSASVRDSDAGPNEPLERELVFDIDMNDYDEYRTCCQGAVVCKKCWKYLEVACKCLIKVLDLSFGYKNVLCVYSGRRGIHLWVADGEARRLNNSRRKDLVEFMSSTTREHTPFHQVYTEILRPYLDKVVIEDQNLFATEHQFKYLQELLSRELKQHQPVFLRKGHSSEVWNQFTRGLTQVGPRAELVIREVMFKIMYPKIDVHVSTGMNHLLKSPFSIHPSTQKLCVTFLPDQVEYFDIDSVPTLDEIISGQVSMDIYNRIFNEFVANCIDHAKEEASEILAFFRALEAQSGSY